MKTFLKIFIFLCIIAIILLLLFGKGGLGLGFSNKKSSSKSDTTQNNPTKTENSVSNIPKQEESTPEATITSTENNDKTIIITVSDKIDINGTIVENVDNLKETITELNKDGLSYILKDNHSTESLYKSVKKVLEDLKLEYTEQ